MISRESDPRPLTIRELVPPLSLDRRSFIRTVVIGGLTITVGGIVIPLLGEGARGQGRPRTNLILVDFNRCTGCRTCEAVCAQYNHRVAVDGEEIPGLGNPFLSNIRVYPFNPDVDVPVVCVMCQDNPCIESCPVEPDAAGRRALFRDSELLTVNCNTDRCISCGSCAEVCRTKRVGAIIPNRETGRPERLCTLCGGDPQCVKHCPYGALEFVQDSLVGSHYAMGTEEIARELARRWYGEDVGGGGTER